MTVIASQALSSAQTAAQPTFAARNRISSSTKNGELPDGREVYIRKPRMKRQWEPVENHTCSSCGMLYPRAPFDWEELGNTEDGKVICALRKTCKSCTFPAVARKNQADQLEETQAFVRRLHPDFTVPASMIPEGHKLSAPASLLSNVQSRTVASFFGGTSQPQKHASAAATSLPSQSSPAHGPLDLPPVQAFTYRPPDISSSETPTPRSFGNGNQPSGNRNQLVQRSFPLPKTTGSSTTPQLPTPHKLSSHLPLTQHPTPSLDSGRVHAASPVQYQPASLQSSHTNKPSSMSRPQLVLSNPASSSHTSNLPTQTPSFRRTAAYPVPSPSPAVATTSLDEDMELAPKPDRETAKKAYEGMRRVFDRNPNPSKEALEALTDAYNFQDYKIVEKMFEAWRSKGIRITSSNVSDPAARSAKSPSKSGTKGFEEGFVMSADGQRIPQAEPSNEMETSGLPVAETEEQQQLAAFDLLMGFRPELVSPKIGTFDNSKGSPSENQHGLTSQDQTIDGPLQPNNLLRSEPISARDSADVIAMDSQQAPEDRIPADAERLGSKDWPLNDQSVKETLRIVVPGMEQLPPSLPQAYQADGTPLTETLANPPSTATRSPVTPASNSPLQAIDTTTEDAQPMDVDSEPERNAEESKRSKPVPSTGFSGLPASGIVPNAAPVVSTTSAIILPIQPHPVKHWADPILQTAYEIYTAQEGQRIGNWLKATFRPASEKYSVLQRSVYTEYKTLFEGSPVPLLQGSQMMSFFLKTFPTARAGVRLDPEEPDQSKKEFRIWGVYRVKIFEGSPWELLYNGLLKANVNRTSPRPIDLTPSQASLFRRGADISSLASIHNAARLDKDKIRRLSRQMDAISGEEEKRVWECLPRSLPTYRMSSTPLDVAVTERRLNQMTRVPVDNLILVRKRRRSPPPVRVTERVYDPQVPQPLNVDRVQPPPQVMNTRWPAPQAPAQAPLPRHGDAPVRVFTPGEAARVYYPMPPTQGGTVNMQYNGRAGNFNGPQPGFRPITAYTHTPPPFPQPPRH